MTDRVDEDHEEFCLHYGDGTRKRYCSKCSGSEDRAKKDQDLVDIWIPSARYEGECRWCEMLIEIGDEIARLVSGKYVHASCVDERYK